MPTSTKRARLSVILITLVMNAALVVTSVAGYISARRSSVEITTAAAMGLLHSVSRDFRHSNTEPEELLKSAAEEMNQQGLRYLGLLDGAWNPVLEAGTKIDEIIPGRKPIGRGKPLVRALNNTWSVRVTTMVPGCHGPYKDRCWMGRIQAGHSGGPFLMVADIESSSARETMSRAVATLVVSLTAAAILLLAAGVFFRFSRQAEIAEVQLAKDRHLKSLGQMSAVLGHELRNPIASLKGHAQLLLKKVSDDHPGKGSLTTVLKEAERLEVLTDQVLDFAKTGKLDLGPADPAEIVRVAIEKSGADPVNTKFDGNISSWNLDSPKMEQVLVNLLYNARHFSEEGAPIDIEVGLDGESMFISCRDYGEGIEVGDEQNIFEPFFTKKTRGTGLGLSLAKRIVEGHGGRIEAFNHSKGGAVFRIEIPRQEES